MICNVPLMNNLPVKQNMNFQNCLFTLPGDTCAAEVSADSTGGEQHVCITSYVQSISQLKKIFTVLIAVNVIIFYKLQTSPDKQPLVKTVGPLTDADVIRLRPCEKKQVYRNQPSSSQ